MLRVYFTELLSLYKLFKRETLYSYSLFEILRLTCGLLFSNLYTQRLFYGNKLTLLLLFSGYGLYVYLYYRFLFNIYNGDALGMGFFCVIILLFFTL